MKILFVHMLNNYTGSPNVLRNTIRSFTLRGDEVVLLTSRTDGFLSNIDDVKYKSNMYKWTNNKLVLVFLLLWAELVTFFKVLFEKNVDVVFVNTVLPFGAAIAGKIKKKKIIYHVHEAYLNPNVLQRFSLLICKKCSSKIICVSRYVADTLNFIKAEVLFNSNKENYAVSFDLSDEILKKRFEKKIIMMPSSLKIYKGVIQFIELAKCNTDYFFKLICSTNIDEIETFIKNKRLELPSNLELLSNQKEMSLLYENASLVMNLSLPDGWVETFGMTLIEGFAFGIPVLAPKYGGPLEIVNNEENGFLIEPYDLNEISDKLKLLFSNYDLYAKLANNAFESANLFSFEKYRRDLFELLEG